MDDKDYESLGRLVVFVFWWVAVPFTVIMIIRYFLG